MPAAIPFIVAAGEFYAATTAMSAVASGLYFSAGVVTTIGALTKNEKLSMLGGVLALGGGIAGSAAASGAQSAADAVRLSDSVYAGADTSPVAAPAAADTANVAQEAVTSAAQPGAVPAAPAAPPAPGGLINENMTGVGRDGLISDLKGPLDTSTPVQQQALADNAPPTTSMQSGIIGPEIPRVAEAGARMGQYGEGSNWWDGLRQALGDFNSAIKDNPGAAKIYGGIIQGGMNYYGNQQLEDDKLKRQKNYQDWVRQRYSDSVRNLSVPTIGLAPQPSGGIIGGQRG